MAAVQAERSQSSRTLLGTCQVTMGPGGRQPPGVPCGLQQGTAVQGVLQAHRCRISVGE